LGQAGLKPLGHIMSYLAGLFPVLGKLFGLFKGIGITESNLLHSLQDFCLTHLFGHPLLGFFHDGLPGETLFLGIQQDLVCPQHLLLCKPVLQHQPGHL
jgi:hypothetical protein